MGETVIRHIDSVNGLYLETIGGTFIITGIKADDIVGHDGLDAWQQVFRFSAISAVASICIDLFHHLNCHRSKQKKHEYQFLSH